MEHLYSIRVLRNSLLRDSVFGVVFSWPKNKIGSKTISTLTYITTVIIWLLWATFVDSSCYNGPCLLFIDHFLHINYSDIWWHRYTLERVQPFSPHILICQHSDYNVSLFLRQFPASFFLLSSPRRLKEMFSNRCQSQLGRDR